VSGVLLAAAVLGYGLAIAAWRRRRPRAAVACLLAGSLALRFFAAGDAFLHAWDERYHALVAKNLMAHPLRPTLYEDTPLAADPRDWLSSHVWLHKPPLALWLMALSMAVFGATEVALRVPSLLLSTAAVYATYRLGRAWRGPDVGLLAALLLSINAFLVLLAAGWFASDHVDTACVSFVALAMGAVASSASAAAFGALGLATGLAVLSKWMPGLLPLGVGLVWHWRSSAAPAIGRRVAVAAVVAAAVVLPWWAFAARAYPVEWTWESGYNLEHLLGTVEGHGGSVLFHVLRMPKIYGELIYVPLLVFLARAAREGLDSKGAALLLWILLPYAVFSLAATKMPAYPMIAAPAVCLVEAEALAWLWSRRGAGPRRLAVSVLVAVVVALPARILLNDLRVFRPYDRRPEWAEELRRLGRSLEGKRAVIFGAPRPIETMFYTSKAAYPQTPDRATVDALRAKGYTVVVAGPGEGLGDDVEHVTLAPDR
jgi:4-amino-4-deoxy-L-arabinose transferase-like glycosyltransferase